MIILLSCWLMAGPHTGYSQNFQIDGNSIGLIVQDSGQILGTGFVCAHKNLITTCAHLFEHSGNRDLFTFITRSGDYKVKIVYKSFDRDIAILKLDTVIVDAPILLPEQFKFKLNDSIVLAGFDRSKTLIDSRNTINASPTCISGYHEEKHSDDTRKLLEFYGIAQPGYSGGPIFKWDGKVYAMLQGGMPNVNSPLEEGKSMNFAIVLDELHIIFEFLSFQGIIEK